MKNIYLVGFMGTGKTTVGKILANKLSRKFVEMDQIIEQQQGKKITDIFVKEGEEHFRKLEKDLLKELSVQSDLVVSCGGGLVCDQENLKILKNTGQAFSLFASPEVIFERVKHTKQRPLLNGEDPLSIIRQLLRRRKDFYQNAGTRVDTDNYSAQEVAEYILGLLGNG